MAKLVTSKQTFSHRDDAEWLTVEICTEYHNKAKEMKLGAVDAAVHRALRLELQHRCDITEVEAINILNGYHADDYVRKYAREKGILEGTISAEDSKTDSNRKDFLKWVEGLETKKKDDGWKLDD